MFTVLAISNEELWWFSWPQLDRSTGQAAAAFVLREGVEHEGLYVVPGGQQYYNVMPQHTHASHPDALKERKIREK